MKRSNIFWGLFFLGAGALIILGQLDLIQGNMFRIILSVFLGLIAVINLPKRNFFGVFFPIAFILWINRSELAMLGLSSYFSFGMLMTAAAFISIGFSLIFRKNYIHYKGHHYHSHKHVHGSNDHSNIRSEQNEDVVNCEVSFSSNSQYLHSPNLEKVNLACQFGNLQVYFSQATPSANGVEVNVECRLGNIELYIPREWNTRNEVHSSLGSVEEEFSNNQHDVNSPLVTIKGEVSLGQIKIVYI